MNIIDRLARFPSFPTCSLPTPLQSVPRLRAALGDCSPTILIKRDDLTGLAAGGNKARKLAWLIGDALNVSADTLITCGAAQSNHALQTVAAAGLAGMSARCVLYGSPEQEGARLVGNLHLHHILGTRIRWVRMGQGETRREQALRRGLAEEEAAAQTAGLRPYVIPTGGSTAIGALGYVHASHEIHAQLDGMEPKAIYFASGSGGTQAGLMVGCAIAGISASLEGVEVDSIPPDASGVSPYRRAVRTIANAASALMELPAGFTDSDVLLRPEFSGPAYGARTPEAEEAIELTARTEGIFLDPVYTGKAMSALISDVRAGRYRADDSVIFWHTGGLAGLFAREPARIRQAGGGEDGGSRG